MKTAISERLVGKEYTSVELAGRLNSQADVFRLNGGGITFSGGEPLMQAEFLLEVIEYLDDIHVLLDTSGYGNSKDFLKLLSKTDLVFFDLKILDPSLFCEYTGGDLNIVLENLRILNNSGVPYVIRVPLIPGVTDSEENLTSIAKTVNGLSGVIRVDLLPYNQMAGAKYESVNMIFEPRFDETADPNTMPKAFENLMVPWRVV